MVNDLDSEPDVTDTHDVSTVEGANALIDATVSQYGRVDILINNAGNMVWAGMPDVDTDNLATHIAVHTAGSFNTARAAWPHMVAAGYGRIVNTTSAGVFGLWNNTSYATAKSGVIGLTRSLAVAGRKVGITVNAIAPAAVTRMAAGGLGIPEMTPEAVAPIAAYLAHEDCPVTGEIFTAGAGRFARLFIASTEGYVQDGATIEDVAANWSTINDETGYFVPADLMTWSAAFMKHLG